LFFLVPFSLFLIGLLFFFFYFFVEPEILIRPD
jgi:hypothetical protein